MRDELGHKRGGKIIRQTHDGDGTRCNCPLKRLHIDLKSESNKTRKSKTKMKIWERSNNIVRILHATCIGHVLLKRFRVMSVRHGRIYRKKEVSCEERHSKWPLRMSNSKTMVKGWVLIKYTWTWPSEHILIRREQQAIFLVRTLRLLITRQFVITNLDSKYVCNKAHLPKVNRSKMK